MLVDLFLHGFAEFGKENGNEKKTGGPTECRCENKRTKSHSEDSACDGENLVGYGRKSCKKDKRKKGKKKRK